MKSLTVFFVCVMIAVTCNVGAQSLYAAQDQVTLTTYYPSPYGEYTSLKAKSLGVGSSNAYFKANVPQSTLIVENKIGGGVTNPLSVLHIKQATAESKSALMIDGAYNSGIDFTNTRANQIWRLVVPQAGGLYIHKLAASKSDTTLSGALFISPRGNVALGPSLFSDNRSKLYVHASNFNGYTTGTYVSKANLVGVESLITNPANSALTSADKGLNQVKAVMGTASTGSHAYNDKLYTIGVSGEVNATNTNEDSKIVGTQGIVTGGSLYPIGVFGKASTNSTDGDSIALGVYGVGEATGQGWTYSVCGATTEPYGDVGATRKYAGAFFGNVYIKNGLWVQGDMILGGKLWGNVTVETGRVQIGTWPVSGTVYGTSGKLQVLGNNVVADFGGVGSGALAPTVSIYNGEGTNKDGYALVAAGHVLVQAVGVSNTAKLRVNGQGYADRWNTPFKDVAEYVDVARDVEVGDVVAIDPSNVSRMVRARQPYDPKVAGVISESPGIALGTQHDADGKEITAHGKKLLALTGRVVVNACAENGAIEPGDLLTASGTPGYAMKSTDSTRDRGAVIGKALEPLRAGRGKIAMLVMLK